MAKPGGPSRRLQVHSSTAGGTAVQPPIPDKLYFRIGEVAALCRVPTYVLRFWQSEFAQLHPGKSGTGQRLYRRRDVEMALRIKRLLHEEGYTIAGARGVLAAEAAVPPSLRLQPELPLPSSGDALAERVQAGLVRARGELRELLRLLGRPRAPRAGLPAPELLFREDPDEPHAPGGME